MNAATDITALALGMVGVYLLYKDDTLLYIGSSTSVLWRVHNHRRAINRRFDRNGKRCRDGIGPVFNRVEFISEPDIESMKVLEDILIQELNPPLNRAGKHD